MTQLDPAVPGLISEGSYVFEIMAEPEKKLNQWSRYFWQVRFLVKSSSGAHYEYSDVFNPTDDRYRELLNAFGGEKDTVGTIHLPEMTLTGKKFEGEIRHIQSKNSEKVYAILAKPISMKESFSSDGEAPF